MVFHSYYSFPYLILICPPKKEKEQAPSTDVKGSDSFTEEYVTGEEESPTVGLDYEYVYKDYHEGSESTQLGPVLSAETPESGGVSLA